MADPFFEEAGRVEKALDGYGPPRRDAGSSLHWAAFNLRAARAGKEIVDELGNGTAGLERLQMVLPEEWDVLEIVAMSLGFGDVATALDLYANAVYLASGGKPDGMGSSGTSPTGDGSAQRRSPSTLKGGSTVCWAVPTRSCSRGAVMP